MKDKAKARIQELCPNIVYKDAHAGGIGVEVRYTVQKTITLAVVLRAIKKSGVYYAVDENGLFASAPRDDNKKNTYLIVIPGIQWNLEHDNYDDQTQETKDFLANLLS